MSDLDVEALEVSLGGVPVLRGVDLRVPSRSVAAVLGPSGCGKTTLLRAVAGFLHPSGGTIEIAGRQVAGAGRMVEPEHRGVGLVPQEGALFPHLDVAGNVAFGLPRRERRSSSRVGEVLELVGLAGYDRRHVSELSGGQQQRVALARALAPRPSIVLLDEPFSALDAGLRDSVRRQVRAAIDADGATAVLVTHDQDEALSFADSIAVMDAGTMLMQDRPERVYLEPAHLEVARFVGQRVELAGTARDGLARCVLGEVPVQAGADGEGVLVLRPEQLVLGPAGEGVHVRAGAHEYFGHDALVDLHVDGSAAPVRARISTAPPAAGSELGLTVAGTGRFYPVGPSGPAAGG